MTMLTSEGCQSRRQRLWDGIKEDLDLILIADPIHLMYLANYDPDPFVFRSVNSSAVLILFKDGRSTLVADSMVRSFVERAHVEERVAPTWYDGKHSAPPRALKLVQSVLDCLTGTHLRRVGVESSRLPAGIVDQLREDRPGIEFTPIDHVLHRMKRQKDADEQVLIRESIKAIEAGFKAAREQVAPGMTELEAFHIVEQASRLALDRPVPIYGDFVGGARTESGGGPPSDYTLKPGDLFLLDYSVVNHHYRGDFANTWSVGSRATPEHRAMHDSSVEALHAAEAVLHPGIPASRIDEAVRESFRRSGREQYFTSHAGHGLGLGHPDPPYLVPESEDMLMVGDVIAIEPSQKVGGLGCVRVEHNYLITDTGYEQLSHHSLTIDGG